MEKKIKKSFWLDSKSIEVVEKTIDILSKKYKLKVKIKESLIARVALKKSKPDELAKLINHIYQNQERELEYLTYEKRRAEAEEADRDEWEKIQSYRNND